MTKNSRFITFQNNVDFFWTWLTTIIDRRILILTIGLFSHSICVRFEVVWWGHARSKWAILVAYRGVTTPLQRMNPEKRRSVFRRLSGQMWAVSSANYFAPDNMIHCFHLFLRWSDWPIQKHEPIDITLYHLMVLFPTLLSMYSHENHPDFRPVFSA